MTRYAITYDRPLRYDYRLTGGADGSVEANLLALGSVHRRPAGPRTTIGFVARRGVTNQRVRTAVRLALQRNNGKALVAQLDGNATAWTWPAYDLPRYRAVGTWRRLV